MQRRILFTVTNDLTYDQRMIRICSTLANEGYHILLIGRKRPHSQALTDRNFAQHRISCWFKSGKFFYLEYNFRLFWFLLSNRFDAICSIDLDTLLPGYLVSKWKGKPLVYDAHEYFTEVPEVVDRPAVQKIWLSLERWILPKVKYAYTVCESIAAIYTQLYGQRFEVIRNVPIQNRNQNSNQNQNSPLIGRQIGQENFNQRIIPENGNGNGNGNVLSVGRQENEKIILYQGALNEGRGLEQAITAMQWIESAQLYLVGEGDLSQDLRKQVKAMNLERKVVFSSYLTPEELKKLTPQATIGLNLLANKGLSYYFSLANKAFDYVQAQVPALHMNFPEYQKLNAQYEIALLLDQLDPKEVAEKINTLLTDQSLYQRLKANCLPASKEWTWENEAQKLIQLYKQVFDSENG